MTNANALLKEIYGVLGTASTAEVELEQSWMHLGKLLLECKEEEAWRTGGFDSLQQFMTDLRTRFHRGKTQLWGYMAVAEKLLPIIPAPVLEQIGVSKAHAIRRALKKSNKKVVPPDILEAACQQKTTIKEVRAMLGEAFHITTENEKGTWLDLDGFFVTPEERKEIYGGIHIAKTLLGLANDIPEHLQRKDIFLALIREFVGTHATEVYGPQQPINTPARLLPQFGFTGTPTTTDGQPIIKPVQCGCGHTAGQCEHVR